jgi:hypothetical protein
MADVYALKTTVCDGLVSQMKNQILESTDTAYIPSRINTYLPKVHKHYQHFLLLAVRSFFPLNLC